LFAAPNAYALHNICLQTYAAYFRDTTLEVISKWFGEGTTSQAAEKLDVALDFGWSSASALHNWRVCINGFSR
jgi:hypothetical protein